MRLATLTLLALLLGGGSALAGGGAPVPEKPAGNPPSGRPGAILDEATCEKVWSEAKDKAASYVTNLQMVDTDRDGKISEQEFKAGCSKGWVQEHPTAVPPASGGGQTPQQPE